MSRKLLRKILAGLLSEIREWGRFFFIEKIEPSPNFRISIQDKEYFGYNFLFWRCLFDFFDKSENFAIMISESRGRAVW